MRHWEISECMIDSLILDTDVTVLCQLDLRREHESCVSLLTLKVLVPTTDAQWEGMGDVGSVRYEPALIPPCPTIRVLSYSN